MVGEAVVLHRCDHVSIALVDLWKFYFPSGAGVHRTQWNGAFIEFGGARRTPLRAFLVKRLGGMFERERLVGATGSAVEDVRQDVPLPLHRQVLRRIDRV